MKKEVVYKLLYALAMFMYGTTGCFYRFIGIPAGLLVLLRAIIGVLFILLFMLITKHKANFIMIKKNLLWLIFGGISIGLNWIFLFEAYNYTTVASASLINYLAPAVFIVISPFIIKEKFSSFKLIFVGIALIGVVLVSGFNNGGINPTLGIVLSILAAIGYIGILSFNKLQHGVDPYDKVVIELSSACIVMIPYALIKTDFSTITITTELVIYVLIFGIILTGVAYVLYLGSMEKLESIHVVILSYVEPVASVLLSVIVLHEHLSALGIIGGIMILGSTLACELIKDKKRNTEIITLEDTNG